MAIEHRPESDFPYWVVRNDGAIVCACASEDLAERFDSDEELRAKAARISALQEEAQKLGYTLEPSRWQKRFIANFA